MALPSGPAVAFSSAYIRAQDESKEHHLEAWLATNKDVLLDFDLKLDREPHPQKLYPLRHTFYWAMERMTQLGTLAISGCEIPHGLHWLSKLEKLTLLHFDDCMVPPGDLCSLSQLSALQSLRVCYLLWPQPKFHTADGDAPDDTMTDVLNSISETHPQLTSLEIRLSGPTCVCLEPFPSSLHQLKQLQQLSLSSMMVMPQDLQQAKQLPWVAATLRVQADRQLVEEDLPAWMQQQHGGPLKHMNLRFPSSYVGAFRLLAAAASRGLSSFPSITHLQSLGIFRFDLTQSSHHIAALTALTSLQLAGSVLDDEVLVAVATLTSLSILTLKDNKMVTKDHETFRILAAGLQNLSSLCLRGDILSAPNLAAVASSMQQLNVLELGSLLRVKDAVCLSSLVNLTSLKFQKLQLGAGERAGAAVTALTKLSKLASLVIVQQESQFGVEQLLALTEAMQLTRLKMWAEGCPCGRELLMKVIWGSFIQCAAGLS